MCNCPVASCRQERQHDNAGVGKGRNTDNACVAGEADTMADLHHPTQQKIGMRWSLHLLR